ncbi:retrovirus-related pol polyprotein from transposon TNT 1-94 [Tanacetum coccineum]|uniref:Retrovirus-related pol polyprotein from transposon TNT 1-94 n=1 Tax=Tanacetum coccineum TaxID=301880 RepID=A0ABQ5EED1_9ASTR
MKAEALKEQTTASRPIKALTVYPPNTPATLVPRGLTEGERGFEQTKECYLTEVIPFFKTLKEHFEGNQKALNKEIKEMKEIFEVLEVEVDQNVVNRKYDEIERKNLLIANDNLIADYLSKEVFYIATNSELTVSRFTEMHDAHNVDQARCLELEAELYKLNDKIQKDDHNELVKRFSNVEVNHLNLQLKYQHLKESFGNNTSLPARDAPDFDSVFITQLTEKVIVLQEQNEPFRAKNAKIKQHYKELYDSIKITRAKHIEQTTALLTENENLKAQIHENMKRITMDYVKPRVLAPGRYAIDVEPIPPRNRNNKEVYLDYLKHLKESVKTLRGIVKEAKELLEYVIGTYPKDFNKQDKKHASTPLTRKKQVTFEDQCETSNNNTHKHVEKLNIQKTNVPVIPSTGVNSCTDTSGSKPMSNTKKNRISPAKSVNKKKVEEHPRTNKSSVKNTNHVDSSISSKLNYFHSMNASPFVKNVMSKVKKVWKPKQVKQVWKATGKVLTNVGYQWKPTRRIFTLGEQCPLTRLTKSNVLPVQQTKNVSRTNRPLVFGLRLLKTYDGDRSRLRNFVKKLIGTVRFGNDHFGAIMGYGDYVIGDSVISRVYYVEGLGHNMFSVRQFCNFDLKVAFRKHSCYVQDTDDVNLSKGSCGSNLYTISVEDMMKSSPICLLSKASKNKSWLWHRRLNHLNFSTINDLARKDLVRGLPRLKFEKDHLCSACQLGKSKKHTHTPKTENTNLEVLNTLHMDLCGPISKDETPEFVIKFLKQIQVGLNKTVRYIHTDNGTEFVNQVLTEYYESVGIFHQKSVPRTPQQNDVVERQNRTLVEAARTMLIFSKAPMFLWAEAVATACYTQNRSLIHTRHNKTPYELVHDKKPDLTFLRVFGALCYPTNDIEDLGKL